MSKDFSKTIKTIDYEAIGKNLFLAEKKLGALKEKREEVTAKIDEKMAALQEYIDKLNHTLETTMPTDATVEVKDDTYTKKVQGMVTFSLSKEMPKFNVTDEKKAKGLFPKTVIDKKAMNAYLKECNLDGSLVLDSQSKEQVDWIGVTKYRTLKKYWLGKYKKDKKDGK